jgi:hypothetical protein
MVKPPPDQTYDRIMKRWLRPHDTVTKNDDVTE